MGKNLVALLLGVMLLGGASAGALFIMDRLATTPADREFRAAFREVEVGMPEHRLIEILGEPDERSPTFFLAQETGFEDVHRRAAESNSVRYLVWRRGLDLVYTVGISASGEVAIAAVGGT